MVTHYIGSLRISLAIFNLSNHPVSAFPVLGPFCRGPWSGSDSRFLIHFGADIPKNDLRGDVSVDWLAVLEQLDARFAGTIEPIIGLTHHRRYS
jgi:hypothetical protein